MNLTAPQRRLLNEATIDDYYRDLVTRTKGAKLQGPDAIDYLRRYQRKGLSTADLMALLRKAQMDGYIDQRKHDFFAKALAGSKRRTERITGRIDPRDSAIHNDADNAMTVQCSYPGCKKEVNIMDAKPGGAGWICNKH